MNIINYHNRTFRTIQNTGTGEVNQQTIFKYYQKENMVWAEYSGGGIILGSLIATVDENGNLDMRYQHINERNEIMTGKCSSRPEILENSKLRIHEEWEWTCKDFSKGQSILEEI